MSDARRASLLAIVGLTLSCKGLEPTYFGRLYCFEAVGAYGTNEESQNAAIHRDGNPVKVCFCYCDELHADTQLFTGPNAPDPPQDWLDRMAKNRTTAVEQCQQVAASLELTDDNCEEAMPMFPTWWETEVEHPCAAKPNPDGPYCTEVDPVFGDDSDTGGGSDTDTGESPPITPAPPVTRAATQITAPSPSPSP